ncbi:MAG: polysaccharide biosynthesis tyrosine autokinase, partial [bacterium]
LKAMNAEYQAAMAEQSKLPENEMDYTRLERDVKAYEAVYNFLIDKDQEARIDENSNDSGIVVVDAAFPPDHPVAPQRTRVMILSLLGGLLLSIGAGYSLDRWQDEVGGEADLARLSGLPVLALISDWRKEGTLVDSKKTKNPAGIKAILEDDSSGLGFKPWLKHSYFNESFRSLRTNLAFSGVDRKIRSFSVLSANASEGKSLVNANLALALAASGGKVLLVDADLRKSKVHKMFGLAVRKDQGLPLLLSGQVPDLDAHLYAGPVPGLWLLPCGVLAPNPSELLGSESFVAALELMKARFDHVVFDAAPILPVTDGVILASRMDGVAVLALSEKTRRAELSRALHSLATVQASVVGMILNGVDMRKYAYTYGYRSRYYSYQNRDI